MTNENIDQDIKTLQKTLSRIETYIYELEAERDDLVAGGKTKNSHFASEHERLESRINGIESAHVQCPYCMALIGPIRVLLYGTMCHRCSQPKDRPGAIGPRHDPWGKLCHHDAEEGPAPSIEEETDDDGHISREMMSRFHATKDICPTCGSDDREWLFPNCSYDYDPLVGMNSPDPWHDTPKEG